MSNNRPKTKRPKPLGSWEDEPSTITVEGQEVTAVEELILAHINIVLSIKPVRC